MKKIFIFIICSIFITLFCSCSFNINSYVKDNLSDIRYSIYDGETNKYFASLTFGKRENPYKSDGLSNDLIEFGLLEIMTYENLNEEQLPCKLFIDNKEINLILEKNPFTFSYMVDLGKIYDFKTINIEFLNIKTELKNINKNWKIQYDNALKIGKETFFKEIKNLEKNKKKVEFYLKIFGRTNIKEEKYFYWSFSIKGKNYHKTCLIDINTGEVLVKN